MRPHSTLESLYREAQVLRDVGELFDRFVVGKSVLDVGCANYEGECSFGLVHAMILERCARCVGVDISPAVLRLPSNEKAKYFQGNAEEFCLPETFDTIFAGDLIEHLSNPGKFLGQARKMMHASSDLVVVTPNPYGFRNFVGIFRRFEPPIHPEHTMLVPIAGMNELASRHELFLKQVFLIKGQAFMPHDRFFAKAYKAIYHGMLALPIARKLADTYAFWLSSK